MVFKHQSVEFEDDDNMEYPSDRLSQHPDVQILVRSDVNQEGPNRIGYAENKIPEEGGIAPPKASLEELQRKKDRAEQRYNLKNNS